MYRDNNRGNPVAHALGFTVITEGIRKELAFPGSIVQKDVSAFVKEELPCLLEHQLLAPHRGCASAADELILCVKSLCKCNSLIPLP